MSITCNHCQGTGFLNIDQYTEITGNDFCELKDPANDVLIWLSKIPKNDKDWDHDVQVCDCCGDGEGWYGEPGEHYNSDDLPGNNGPYAYNGGLCECN